MIIGNKNSDKEVLVIAEIGNNHEGNMDIAIRLIREAARCGLDAVKFQTYKTEFFVNPSDTERYERMKSFELSYSQFTELADFAHSLGLLFISTPLDLESAKFLDSIVDAFKIASGDNDFFPLIDEVMKTGKPVILSSGASEQKQLKKTLFYISELIKQNKRTCGLGILHCVSCYPVPEEQTGLLAIRTLIEDYPDCTIGYSDHTTGIDAAIASVATGAKIVEKHFTLDKQFSSFRDHQLSADPADMQEMMKRIRTTSRMMGSGRKIIQPCEEVMNPVIRRSIAAKRNLKAGHLIEWDDLMWIRPLSGMRPGEEEKILGKRLIHDMKQGDFFSVHCF
jgi:N,N'-diacetyllegionaminate synthase